MKDPFPKNPSTWPAVTEKLLSSFPLPMAKVAEIALASWEDIFHSRLGTKGYQIGKDIWPEPQIMGFLLHELIPLNLAASYPRQWKRGASAKECDAVFVPNDDFSFEIKTSSSAKGIFGNRSYAYVSPTGGKRRG